MRLACYFIFPLSARTDDAPAPPSTATSPDNQAAAGAATHAQAHDGAASSTRAGSGAAGAGLVAPAGLKPRAAPPAPHCAAMAPARRRGFEHARPRRARRLA